MSDFEELSLPDEETIDVNNLGKWFVTIKRLTFTNSGMLTIDGSGIKQASRNGDYSMFYFDNVIQAFNVSWLYYTKHGKPYPYMDEWEDAKNNTYGMVGLMSESTVMEFV